MPSYGDPHYWDDRYSQANGQMFDWLEDYNQLQSLIGKYLKPHHKILVLGCGNAKFSEDLYDAGFKNIYNVDISSVVIKQMMVRNKQRIKMQYETMDVINLKYDDNFFDVAIDKSTIDAILCGDNAFLYTAIMLKEVQRVIKEDGGVYIAISYGKPSTRSFHFERKFLSWTLKEFVLYPVSFQNEEEKEEKSHYIYVCTKNLDWRQVNALHFEKEILKIIVNEKNQTMENLQIEDDNQNYAGSRVVKDIQQAKEKTMLQRPSSA